MTRRSRQRGAALLEMAMGLPAMVLLFIGLSDFSLLFWRQAQLEAFARTAIAAVEKDGQALVKTEEPALREFSEAVQAAAAKGSELRGVTVRLTRRYTCPGVDGADGPLQDREIQCAGQRVYLQVDCALQSQPLLVVLTQIGFPRQTVSRTYVRVF